MSALDNSIREVAALGSASQAALDKSASQPTQTGAVGLSLAPGARVLDLVTGEIGVVQSVAVQTVAIPATGPDAG